MADPLSLTASIIAVVTLANSCVGALRSIYNAPYEVRLLRNEVEELSNLVQAIPGDIAQGEDMHLKSALNRAHSVVEQTFGFIKRELSQTTSSGTKVKRFSILRKNTKLLTSGTEVKRCRLELQDALLLSSRLSLEDLLKGVASMSMSVNEIQNSSEGMSSRIREVALNASSTLQTVSRIECQLGGVSDGLQDLQQAPATVPTSHEGGSSTAIEALHRAIQDTRQEHTADFHHIVLNFQHIKKVLGKQQTHLAVLSRALDRVSDSSAHIGSTSASWDSDKNPSDVEAALVYDTNSVSAESQSELDLFFDCVSNISIEENSYLIEALSSESIETPRSSFEVSSGFFPEQYSLNSTFGSRYTFVGITIMPQSLDGAMYDEMVKYYILYAETPRRWSRVTITIPNANSYGDDIHQLLGECLAGRIISSKVTNIKFPATYQGLPKMLDEIVTEDFEQAATYSTWNSVGYIDDIGCPQYLESEILTERPYKAPETMRTMESNYSAMHRVRVEGQLRIAKRIPFSPSIKGFIHELTTLHRLRGSAGVVEFIGVIVDDEREQLKGFVVESDQYGTIQDLFKFVKPQIPKSVLELWSYQVVSAVAEVHSSGVIIGRLNLSNISVYKEGQVKISSFDLQDMPDGWGRLSPELRREIPAGEKILRAELLTSKNDIFQLGLILWLILDQLSGEVTSLANEFCKRSDCGLWAAATATSQVSEKEDLHQQVICQAKHANPVQLPMSGRSFPLYLEKIIKTCREADPRQRLPAWRLLGYLPNSKLPKQNDPRNDDSKQFSFLKPQPILIDGTPAHVFCDNCGAEPLSVHFHCDKCNQGDYDICQSCLNNGVRCFNTRHWMYKREVENDDIRWAFGGNAPPLASD